MTFKPGDEVVIMDGDDQRYGKVITSTHNFVHVDLPGPNLTGKRDAIVPISKVYPLEIIYSPLWKALR